MTRAALGALICFKVSRQSIIASFPWCFMLPKSTHRAAIVNPKLVDLNLTSTISSHTAHLSATPAPLFGLDTVATSSLSASSLRRPGVGDCFAFPRCVILG